MIENLSFNNVYNIDCLEGMKYLKDESVDSIITDPPYAVGYDKKSKHLAKMDKARGKQIERDKSFDDVNPEYELLSKEMFRVLKKDSHCFLFCSDKQISSWSDYMIKAGFKQPQILIWRKNKTTVDLSFGYRFPENKEIILFFQKGWKKLNGYNIERHLFRSVLDFPSDGNTEFHSCSKPLQLLMFICKLSTKPGDIILDMFSGSGNHLIAFKRLNRRFIGFETSPVYYKTIIKRLKFENSQTRLEAIK